MKTESAPIQEGAKAQSRRRALVAMATAFAVSFMAGVTPTVANAGIATSTVGSFSVAGNNYRNFARIATYPTSNHQASAFTHTAPNGFTAPVGWVGSRGRLFTSGGALSCEGINTYNPSSLASGSYHVAVSCIRNQVGTWYSYGVSRAWNGSGYNSVYTFLSPNQNS